MPEKPQPSQRARKAGPPAITLLQLGLGLALNNLWISLLSPVSLLVVHFLAVVPEEKYLGEKFGDSYRAYLTKVRRYL
jgi:protein-S-isoprenylcysteine O-methyltransferase Ste14